MHSEAVAEFFDALFKGSTGYLAAAYAKEGKWKNKNYNLNSLDKFYADIKEASAKGWNCYYVPSVIATEGRRTKSNFKESRVAWLDYDLPTQEIPKTTHEPSFVVQSSPGKYHMYWLLDKAEGPWPVEGANKFLIQDVGEGADKSGYDCTQLLRVPGTLNYKYDPPTPVELVKAEPSRVYPVKTFPGPFVFG